MSNAKALSLNRNAPKWNRIVAWASTPITAQAMLGFFKQHLGWAENETRSPIDARQAAKSRRSRAVHSQRRDESLGRTLFNLFSLTVATAKLGLRSAGVAAKWMSFQSASTKASAAAPVQKRSAAREPFRKSVASYPFEIVEPADPQVVQPLFASYPPVAVNHRPHRARRRVARQVHGAEALSTLSFELEEGVDSNFPRIDPPIDFPTIAFPEERGSSVVH